MKFIGYFLKFYINFTVHKGCISVYIEYGNPKTNKSTYILYSNNFLADGYSCQTTKKEIANREI